MTTDLYAKQQAIEFDEAECGRLVYLKRVADARADVQHDKLLNFAPEAHLLADAIQKFGPYIDEYLRKVSRVGRGNNRALASDLIKDIPSDELAYITARELTFVTQPLQIARSCRALGKAVMEHVNYINFRNQAPGYLAWLEEQTKSSHMGHRQKVLTHARLRVKVNMGTPEERIGVEGVQWSQEEKIAVGNLLIDGFIAATGLLEVVSTGKIAKKNKKEEAYIQPTKETADWIARNHARIAEMRAEKPPMIVPPKEWSDVRGGGFLSTGGPFASKLVRTGKRSILKMIQKNREQMAPVFQGLNALQSTRWRIATRVLDVMEECAKVGMVAGLPPVEVEQTLPPEPWGEGGMKEYMQRCPDEYYKWNRSRHDAYDGWHRGLSKRIALHKQIAIARKYSEYEAIYFCWNLDWRGRAYPIQTWLHPQVDHVGKALLEFADGKPLDRAAARRLAIFGAGLFGKDKETYDWRWDTWIQENEAAIIDSAENPLDGGRFWTRAEKPFQFLQFCFEWAKWKAEGPGCLSHMPVQVDGKCNGTQHLSAMARDEKGGKYVGLIPQEKPSDLYTRVSEESAAQVEHDAKHGKKKKAKNGKEIDYRALAQAWVGKVTRKIAKRNTMTLSYGATLFGFADQIVKELKKLDADRATEGLSPYLDIPHGPASTYMAQVNYQSIGRVVVKTVEVMEWLQAVSKVCTQAGVPLRWTTPTGFPVEQARYTQQQTRIWTWFGGVKIRPAINIDTADLSTAAQANAISPNFVHSMDASHLMLTINACKAAGIDAFSFIHDSFGTHAADIDQMDEILRDVFIKMYSDNALQVWLSQVLEHVPPEYHGEIPPLPEFGNLDLEGIRHSQYFFAS
jgi:DNA-directed RNA polymerase